MGVVLLTSEATGLSGMLSNITSILTSAVSWVGTVSNTVTGDPLLLLAVVLPFVGFGVGLFRRLLHL